MEERDEKRRELRQKAMRLPLTPGVYLMHNQAGERSEEHTSELQSHLT